MRVSVRVEKFLPRAQRKESHRRGAELSRARELDQFAPKIARVRIALGLSPRQARPVVADVQPPPVAHRARPIKRLIHAVARAEDEFARRTRRRAEERDTL